MRRLNLTMQRYAVLITGGYFNDIGPWMAYLVMHQRMKRRIDACVQANIRFDHIILHES